MRVTRLHQESELTTDHRQRLEQYRTQLADVKEYL